MGHLINPVSSRLSINSFWNSTWGITNNFNYITLFKKDYILFHFLNWFIKRSRFLKSNIIISHYKIFRLNNNVFVNFYYYSAALEERNYKVQMWLFRKLLKKTKKFKKHSFKKRFKKNPFIKLKGFYKYFVKIIVSNLYWYLVTKTFSFYLSKIESLNFNYYFNIYSLNFFNVTSDIVATYISMKLQHRHSLEWILKPVIKDLEKRILKKTFLGYKIVCSGRFTRKQIATYMWMKKGPLPLNNFSNVIKYSESRVRLKYGACGIKVWLNYGSNDTKIFPRQLSSIYPLYVPFKYSINKVTKIITLSLNYWFYTYLRVSFLKTRRVDLYRFFLLFKLYGFLKYFFKSFMFKFSKLIKKRFWKTYNLPSVSSKVKLKNVSQNKFLLQFKPLKLNYLKSLIKTYE